MNVPTLRDRAARVARHGLCSPETLAQRVTPEVWPGLLRMLDRERLSGLALAQATTGELDVDDAMFEELVGCQRRWMAHSLRHERSAATVCAQFEARGISALLLKGAGYAHRHYPDPAWRPFGDVDVLVRDADWDGATGVLERAGYSRTMPSPRPGFDARFGKAAVHRHPSGVEVDLHRTLAIGPFGFWVRPAELFDSSTTVQLGETTVRCPDDAGAFVHACLHASLGRNPPGLVALRDVVQTDTPGVDWDRVARWAERWQVGVVIQHAIEQAARLLGHEASDGARAAAVVPATRASRRALRAYTTADRWRGATARATLRALPGPRARAAYAWSLLAPSREFLEAREGGSSWGYRLRRARRSAPWVPTSRP